MTNSERLAALRKKREEEEKKSSRRTSNSGSTTSANKSYKNSDRLKKSKLERTIGFDTFESDLKTVGTTVEDIYNGWQTQETMTNARSTVESMRDRVSAFQEYQKLFGGENAVDISDLANSYNAVLNDWDTLSETYGQYKNADSFNTVKKKTQLDQKFRHADGTGYTFEEVQEELKKYAPDSDEYKYLSTYTNYSDLNDFNKAIENFSKPSERQLQSIQNPREGKIQPGVNAGTTTSYSILDKSTESNYNSLNDGLEKGTGIGPDYYNELIRKKNLHEQEHKVDLYKPEYESKEDFEEKSQYVTTYNEDKVNIWGFGPGLGTGYEDPVYEFINDVDGAREKLREADRQRSGEGNGYESEWDRKGYHLLHDDEILIYNYKKHEEGQKSADKFLEDMQPVLDKRRTSELAELWEENVKKMPVLSNAATIIAKPAGAVLGAIDDAINGLQGKDYNPYSYLHTVSNAVSHTREYTSDKIEESTEGFELLGQNIPSFLYNTGMSIADSAYGVTTFGGFHSVLMGTSAFQDKAREMVEAGESQDVIWQSAITSGVAEMLFEHIGIDNLFKIKSVDSLKSIVKNTLKQAGAEAFEEIGTEITNIIADDVIRGKNSELYKMYSDLIARGYSEKEASSKVALKAGSQVAWAGIGGALSGGVMGGVTSVNNYVENKTQGKTIRGNERIRDVLDISSMTPQESEAYKAYTEYANKGINADNITDAQLGNLYNTAKSDAIGTLNSKDGLFKKGATEEQKRSAVETLHKLNKVDTDNVAAKKAKELIKDLKTGENTEITETGKSATIKGIKIDTNEVITAEGETVSENDVTFSERDKELLGYAKQMDETTANLLFEIDDGETDVTQYIDSFNLSVEYAKHRFSQDYILEHRGVLSTAQVNSIYKTTVLNPRMARQKRLSALVQEMGGDLEIKGTIDDSAIDYDNTGAEGKINWNKLHRNVRGTIAYISVLATNVAGTDVQLVTNGRDYGFTGTYDRQGNKMFIDITALTERVKSADAKGRKDNSKFIITTVAHEVTHWMEDKAEELYDQYSKMVMEALTSGGMTEEEVLGRRRLRMEAAEAKRAAKEKRAPREIGDGEVRREVIARASEDMLALSEEGKKIFESLTESEQKQFVDKIQEVLQNIKDWIKNVLSKLKSDAPEAQDLRALAKDLDAISKKWDEMLREAAKVNAAMKKKGINDKAIMESKVEGETQNADIDYVTPQEQFQIDFESAVDKILASKNHGIKGSVVIGRTPQSLTKIGVNQLPLTITPTHIYSIAKTKAEAIAENRYDKNLHYHGLGADAVKQIGTELSNPIMVLQHHEFTQNQKNKSASTHKVIAVVELVVDGKRVIAPIEIDAEVSLGNKTYDSNHVSSYFDKDSFNEMLKEAIAKENIGDIGFFYLDKKRAMQIFKTAGSTYPTTLNTHNSNIIVRDIGLKVNKKISNFTQSLQFKRWFGDWQNDPQKASKVVNADGTPKIMYHGSPENFSIFDRKKSKNGSYGRGFYFTDSASHGGQYGNVRAFYLDIKNPLDASSNAHRISKKQLKAFLNEVAQNEDYGIENYGEYATVDSLVESFKGKSDFDVLQDINATCIGDFVAAIELFNQINGTKYDGIITPTETVTFSETQQKSATDNRGTYDKDNPDVYYSDIDEVTLEDLNAQLKEKQNQIYSATKELKKFDHKAEEDKLYAVMRKDGVPKEELDAALQEYSKWSTESGYGAAFERQSALKDEERLLRREIQKIEDKLHEELKKQISHFSEEDVKKYVSKAVGKYHTTSRLENASYLLTTGSMLDFSDGQGYRVKDHREISEILDLPDYAEYSDGMIAFMNMGNIRLQTYGIDISAMPNAKQISALRDIIFKVMREYDEFSVDFSKTNGYSAGSVTYGKGTSASKIVADIKSYFETGVVPEDQSGIRDFLYSDIDSDGYAPTFYSYMGKIINEIKQEKIGANSVVPYLKGKGVKSDEIKWSGIEAFLEGKKSVTKAELQEFVEGSQLQIEDRVIDGTIPDNVELKHTSLRKMSLFVDGKTVETYTKNRHGYWVPSSDQSYEGYADKDEILQYELPSHGIDYESRWEQYKLDGGKNYREYVFRLPNSDYSNKAMQVHWGKSAKGILAHARVQDFKANGKKMLFIEEIQSDWHNAGHKNGYKGENQSDSDAEIAPDAPFRDTYHEYVLKSLIRNAVEEGYDSIGWTTADIQSERWSDEFAEGYRIEYDQDIPKFLRKYGKRWGATVGKTSLEAGEVYYDAKRDADFESINEWKRVVKEDLELDEMPAKDIRAVRFVKKDGYIVAYGRDGTEYDRAELKTDAYEVWSMDITDSMKNSVLYEGQVMYSDIDEVVDLKEQLKESIRENRKLHSENKKLQEDFERLVERLKLERQVTGNTAFNRNQLDAVAAHIRNLANSDYSKKELVKQLDDVYTYIITSKELTWEDLYARLYGISQTVLEESRLKKVDENDYYKTVLKEIRSKKISLSDVQKQELESAYGISWNKAVFGRLNVSDDATMDLDSQWSEWANVYPGLFDAETTEGNQIIQLLEMYDDLKDGSEIYEDLNNEDMTRWLANEIYNQYWNVSTIKTTADKYEKKIKMLNFEHRKAMKELRDNHEERLAKQKQTDKSKYEEVIKKIRKRKEEEIQEVRKLGKERMDRYKENAKRKTVMQSILSTTTSLNKKFLTNSKDVHIPEVLKPVVRNLIAAIDFSSKRLLNDGDPTKRDIALEKTFSKARSMADENISLKDAVWEASKMFTEGNNIFSTLEVSNDLSLAMLDLDLVEKIVGTEGNNGLLKSIDVLEKKFGDNGFVLENMSIDDLNILNAMVKSINHWANQVDKALAIKHKEGIANLGMQTIEEDDALGEYKERGEAVEGIKKFLSWSNLLPVNAFERMGSAAKKVFESLQDAQDKLVFNQDEIEEFTAKLFKGKEKEIKKWREDVRQFDLDLPNGKKKTIRMPVSYMMSLYAVAKQEDAMRHLMGVDQNGNILDQGGGMTIKGFKDKGGITKDRKNTLLTKELIAKITGELSEDQKYIANELQKFMNEKGSSWGDSVSMALYGIKKFGIKDYFPITVTPTTIKKLNTDNKNTTHFFSILNFGFTKSRNPNAKQSIEIGDIFDVFTNHMTMMAIYNAYALPIYDMVRWYNFHTKTADGEEIGVIKSLQDAFGEGATSYVEKLITDLNGQHESSRLGFINRIFKNTKVAMVGNSLSVAALQPMAYPKAALIISPKYLMKSLFYIKDFGVKKGREKAKKYSGIALWKSKGNFDVDISRSMSTRIMHNETWRDKLIEWSLKGAEKGDEFTWGMLWNACEFEVRDTRKDLKVGSEEFNEAIAKRLREIVYKTQVVDSPLTRSEIMRSPDGMAKSLTMFASELTVAYNIMSEAFVDAHLDVRKNGKKGAMKRNGGKIAKAMTIYTVTSAVSQILTTAMQAFRDDDDDKEFEDYLKMYLSNFALDWLIIGKLPYIKEALNYAQGYSSSRVETVWMDSAFKAAKYWSKAFSGDDEGAARKAIENSLKTISYLSGVAGYNQYRDLMATLDSLGIIEKEEFEEWLDEIFG